MSDSVFGGVFGLLALYSKVHSICGNVESSNNNINHYNPFMLDISVIDFLVDSNNETERLSTGPIIAPGTILTTANSLYLSDPKDSVIIVVLTTYNKAKISPTSLIPHPLWRIKDWKRNNLALIKFVPTKELRVSDNYRVIPLPSVPSLDYPGNLSMLHGLGPSHVDISLHYQYPQINVSVVSNKLCKESFEGIQEDEICVVSVNGSMLLCRGEDGIPLISFNSKPNGELIGLGRIFSTPECDGRIPLVMIRISYYLDWIKENVEKKK